MVGAFLGQCFQQEEERKDFVSEIPSPDDGLINTHKIILKCLFYRYIVILLLSNLFMFLTRMDA